MSAISALALIRAGVLAMTAISVRSPSQYRKFRFTYRFDGTDWCIEVPALSLEEARERVKVLGFARHEGDAPSARATEPARRPRGWFRAALRSA
jgi:hypothetical protein